MFIYKYLLSRIVSNLCEDLFWKTLTDFKQLGTKLDPILNYSNIYIEWKKRSIQPCNTLILLTLIEYGASSSSIDSNKLFIWFFHILLLDGWQKQVMPLDVHVIDKALSV